MNTIKPVSLLVGMLVLSGCASEKGHWEYMVYNPATNSVMTEEQYKQWTVDNNVEYVPPQNGVGASETISMYSSQPYRNYVNYRPYPEINPNPIIDTNRILDLAEAALNRPRISVASPVRASRDIGTANPPKDQNPPVTRQQPLKEQQEKEHSTTKSSPAQPAQQPQQASTTVAQGNTWEQIYRSAVEGNPQAQYQLGVSLVTGQGGAKNYNAGVEWLRKSAMQGYAPAREVLTKLYQGIMR